MVHCVFYTFIFILGPIRVSFICIQYFIIFLVIKFVILIYIAVPTGFQKGNKIIFFLSSINRYNQRIHILARPAELYQIGWFRKIEEHLSSDYKVYIFYKNIFILNKILIK